MKAQIYQLPRGQSIKPHDHRGRMVVNFLLRGAVKESVLATASSSSLVVAQRSAPAVCLGKAGKVHAITALEDAMLLGISTHDPRKSLAGLLAGMLSCITVLNPLAHADGIVTIPKVSQKEMQAHRMGNAHLNDLGYLQVLEQQAMAGNIEAQITLGVSLMEGYAGKEDKIMGLYWLKHAAQHEGAEGFYEAYISDSEEGYVC